MAGFANRYKSLFSKDVESDVGCFVGIIHQPKNKSALAKNINIISTYGWVCNPL